MPAFTATATSDTVSAHEIVTTALARRAPQGTEVVPASRRRTPRTAPATPASKPAQTQAKPQAAKSQPQAQPQPAPSPAPSPASPTTRAQSKTTAKPQTTPAPSVTTPSPRKVTEREVKAALVQVNIGRSFWTAYNAFGSARNVDEIAKIKEAAVAGILTAYHKSGVDAETFAAAAGIPQYALDRFIGGMTAGGLVWPAAEQASRKLGLFPN